MARYTDYVITCSVDADDVSVRIGDNELDILDAKEDAVVAECSFEDLTGETVQQFPDDLILEVRSEDGFGTFFFHELQLSHHAEGVSLSFVCHTPNKFWEGRFGLATFLAAVRDQVANFDNWSIAAIELEDDWKGITLARIVGFGDSLQTSILGAADDLAKLLRSAEIALEGIVWKDAYLTDEDLFCREILHPLLRRMGFHFVRYAHGKKEYGKDFTFSELTPFGVHRHYGLQAKAGNISGKVNSEIDELLGQINDAFAMPYFELGPKEPRYISTFLIAISGSFTENARDKIAEKTPKGLVGSVYFLDRDRIVELIDRFWHV